MSAKPVLLLLPGLMCDAEIWRAQVEALSDAYEVRAFGLFDNFTLKAMARFVLEDAPERFSIAGHSMGARAALEVLAAAPERVERIALLDAGVHAAAPDEPARRQVLLDLSRSEGMEAVAKAWLPPMLAPIHRHDPAIAGPLEAMVRRCPAEVFAKQVRALLARPDGYTRLPMIQVPCALIVGRQDEWAPPAQHEAIQALVPGATLTIIEDCGHMAPAEQPEAVTAALRAWMERS